MGSKIVPTFPNIIYNKHTGLWLINKQNSTQLTQINKYSDKEVEEWH